MKRWMMTVLVLLLAVNTALVPAQAAQKETIEPAYIPSTQSEARCVPLTMEQEIWHQGEVIDTDWYTLYNPETADMMVELAAASTKMSGGDWLSGEWQTTMEKYGYEQLYNTYNNVPYRSGEYRLGWRLMGEVHQPVLFPAVNALIGIQEVEYNGKTRYAVGIVFRGSSDVQDWLADFTAYSDVQGYHEGFAQNAEYFYETLSKEIIFHVGNKYYSLFEIYEKMQEPNSEFCMLVMGHSLGGALTNMLVGRYLYEAGVHPSNLAGYAFATPRTAPRTKVNEYPYHNIYNIINADDLVPAITLAGHERFGTDLVYYPDDAYRAAHYGQIAAENPGKDHIYWRTVGFLGSGAKPHLIGAAYRDIVASVSAEIMASTADNPSQYTQYSTGGYNNWGIGDPVITPYTYGNFTGDIRAGGTLVFDGGVMRVAGDCNAVGGIIMHGKDDYLLAQRDLRVGSANRVLEDHLTAGTVEVKGNFSTDDGWYTYAYHATQAHRTVFSGTGPQTVTAGQEDQFINLYLRNHMVNFKSAIPNVRLAEDAVLTGTQQLTVGCTLDLNGHTLELAGGLNTRDLIMGGGNLQLSGDARIHTIKKVDGQLIVRGDLDHTSTLVFDGGQMRVDGNCNLPASLIMQNEQDYLMVGGRMTLWARDWDEIPDDHLSAGTVELKGDLDFDDLPVICNENAYHETGTHRTILSGQGKQTIWFNRAGTVNRFENLCIRNPQTVLYMVKDARLGEDAALTLTGENNYNRAFVQGTLDLNGHTLTVTAEEENSSADALVLDAQALAFANGGRLIVNGDMQLAGGTLAGTVSVSGDLKVKDLLTFAAGDLSVAGDCTLDKGFVMRDAVDRLLVGGHLNLWSHSGIPADHLTAGTVELKGDLNAYGGNSYYSYHATGTHKTIFSGTGKQTVRMGAMYPHKVLQACLRNPDVVLESVHTLRLMENSVQNDISGWNIYGTLDFNGYILLAKSGEFSRLKEKTGDGGLLKMKVAQADEEAPASITITCEVELTQEEAIHILFTGYDSAHRLVACEIMTFASESEMTRTLSRENWPECEETCIFWLEGDYTPLGDKIGLDW